MWFSEILMPSVHLRGISAQSYNWRILTFTCPKIIRTKHSSDYFYIDDQAQRSLKLYMIHYLTPLTSRPAWTQEFIATLCYNSWKFLTFPVRKVTTQVVQTESFSGSDASFTAPGTLQMILWNRKHSTKNTGQNRLPVLEVKSTVLDK